MMRKEKDSLGELEVDAEYYYGIQTVRALHNFNVSDRTVEEFPNMIWSIAAIKKAAALANQQIGALPKELADAICNACDEIMEGEMAGQFPIDPYHGGGGTSLNMNVNEVIANRANEILIGVKGYDPIHPNTHVNMGQSTNDVIPAAMKMATFLSLHTLVEQLKELVYVLTKKEEEFKDVVKTARTCLQDAVPIMMSQQFSGYRSFAERMVEDVEEMKNRCLYLPLGATAVGTGVGTFPGYLEHVYTFLPQVSGIPVMMELNFFDGLQNADLYVKVSAVLKSIATGLSKMASDFRLLSSGPRAGLQEITLPAIQPGSSIMPGKVNPVLPEMVMQVCFRVYGNDVTITLAADRGELDLNIWEPIIMTCLFESCHLLTNSIPLFIDKCIAGLVANREVCETYANSSLALATVLVPILGYTKASEIAKEALARKLSIQELLIEKGIAPEEVHQLCDPVAMTNIKQSSQMISQRTK